MNIIQLEKTTNKAVEILDRNGVSSYELTSNLKKILKNNNDKDAFEYLERLCNSARGLRDIWIEDIDNNEWLDLLDAMSDSLM